MAEWPGPLTCLGFSSGRGLVGGAGLSWREEQSGAQAPRLMSSLGPGDQPSESGAAAPWGPSLPNPALGPSTSWDPIFATYTAWLGAPPPLTWAGACWVYMGTGKGGLDMVAGGCRE